MRLTDSNFNQEVLESDVPVLVDFWASWCPPCKQSEPLVDKLAEEYNGIVKIGKLNVDQNPNTAAKYGIKGVPTFITFKSGKIVDRKVAAQPESQLRNMLDTVL
jgi:thioredoxin 1